MAALVSPVSLVIPHSPFSISHWVRPLVPLSLFLLRTSGPSIQLSIKDRESCEVSQNRWNGQSLSEHGFCVVAASNGSDALALIRQHPPEAAILDIMMPDMSGLEVLERLHAQDPDLPVIMLTAFPSSQNAITALKLGAFDFIVKGLDHTLVVLTVHRAVRYRRDTLDRQQEVARLRARIAELEGALAAR
jgi:DNA-binding NtrC family response regulator